MQNVHLPSTSTTTTNLETRFDSMLTIPSTNVHGTELNKVGQSVFYDCIDLSPTAEKQDDMKPEKSDTEEESI